MFFPVFTNIFPVLVLLYPRQPKPVITFLYEPYTHSAYLSLSLLFSYSEPVLTVVLSMPTGACPYYYTLYYLQFCTPGRYRYEPGVEEYSVTSDSLEEIHEAGAMAKSCSLVEGHTMEVQTMLMGRNRYI